MPPVQRRRVARAVGATAAAVAYVGAARVALAHGASLRSASASELAVPTWLVILTGGGAVGASFILASFATDRAFVASLHEWTLSPPAPRGVLRWAGRAVGLAGLALVLYTGVFGPTLPLRNAAVLLVWVGWWAGFTMVTYLVGNAWPAVDPVRTLAGWMRGRVDYPERLGAWPGALALLVVVYVEVVSPLGDRPRLLAGTVLAYVAVALAGTALVGGETWRRYVDPLSAVFRAYGRVAPVQADDDGLRVHLPGSALTDASLVQGETGVVVALLWGTTFDGVVATPAWNGLARAVVGAGVPAHLLYFVTLFAGFGVFYGAFRVAARLTRRTAPTYRRATDLTRAFAPSLLPIAAGYHLAHYFTYFLGLSPALLGVLSNPLAPPTPRALVLPDVAGGLGLAFVLVGHVLAVWVAHGISFREFPGRLQAIRSQYALTVVMVAYTITSLWIISQPTVTPAYL